MFAQRAWSVRIHRQWVVANTRSLMQMVNCTPSAGMLSQLAKFPEFVEAAKAQESGKHAMAATAMSRVVDVCESALGAGSEMHLAALRKWV